MSASRTPDRPSPCESSSSVDGGTYIDSDPGLLFPVTQSSLLARRLLRLRACSSHGPVSRRKREMIPPDKKDAAYWDKRQKNNEAAKRSREKRRLNDLMVEGQLLALSDENARLRAQVLSLQYHSRLSADKSKAASAETSTWSLSPRPTHIPALLQAGLSSPASYLGQQERAIHQFEASARGVGGFDPQTSLAQQSLFHFPGLRVRSPRAVLEAEMEAQRQVSYSDDIPQTTDASSGRAFLPTPDTLHHASILSYPPPNWLVPHVKHPAMCNNFLLPWRSSYRAPPAVYPGLPLYVQERQGPALGVEADIQKGLKSRFSSAPAGLSQVEMHLTPDGH
ncbi:uncharacterized protein [Pagrus major]|uniref:uncharacterized protein n=1 Tax=Pagrus major TaxID=143350 RepID=UPI003CC84512